MGTQLQIVEVCLEAIRWPPRSRSESPHRLVKILGLASQVFGPTQFSHLTFFFRMKQIAHCTGTWDRKDSGNPHKKWRITTRKKSLSTSFKRALFELSVVWLEPLINCSNVLKSSIDPQTLNRFLLLLQFMIQGFPTQFLIGRSSPVLLLRV